MTITILILTILNTLMFSFTLIQKFNDTFCIVKKEVYEALAEYYSENHDDEGNEIGRELAGGCGTEIGFFKEYLDEEEEEEEE